MLDIIIYDNIVRKNEIESLDVLNFNSRESLIHTLNIIDFMNALNCERIDSDNESIKWIILETK